MRGPAVGSLRSPHAGQRRDGREERDGEEHAAVSSAAAQGTSRRSAAASRQKRATANAARMTTAAYARAVSSWGIACRMRWPRPVLDPAYSANTAPMTATATAIFAPLSAAGSAAGSSAKRNACQRDASSVRRSFSRSASTARSASSVVTTIGKKQTRAMITTFGPSPKPSHTTSSGAMTTTGSACDATSSG